MAVISSDRKDIVGSVRRALAETALVAASEDLAQRHWVVSPLFLECWDNIATCVSASTISNDESASVKPKADRTIGGCPVCVDTKLTDMSAQLFRGNSAMASVVVSGEPPRFIVATVSEFPTLLPDELYRGSALQDRVDFAVKKERERCAKIATGDYEGFPWCSLDAEWWEAAQWIAARIRSGE
jgi:hypothetical protein